MVNSQGSLLALACDFCDRWVECFHSLGVYPFSGRHQVSARYVSVQWMVLASLVSSCASELEFKFSSAPIHSPLLVVIFGPIATACACSFELLVVECGFTRVTFPWRLECLPACYFCAPRSEMVILCVSVWRLSASYVSTSSAIYQLSSAYDSSAWLWTKAVPVM